MSPERYNGRNRTVGPSHCFVNLGHTGEGPTSDKPVDPEQLIKEMNLLAEIGQKAANAGLLYRP